MMQEMEFALLHEAKYVALYLMLLWMVVLVVFWLSTTPGIKEVNDNACRR